MENGAEQLVILAPGRYSRFGVIIFQKKFVFELMINLERNRKRSEEETVRLKCCYSKEICIFSVIRIWISR